MKLVALTANNFRVFDHFRFEFPQDPGLYLITGRNEDRPELGTNGVGKTSLWDAVIYALHAQSTRGLKGPDLVRTGQTDFSVELTLDTKTVARTWDKARKAQLKTGGKDVSQDEVTKAIGYDVDTLLTAAIIPQAEPLFADLGPAAQITTLQRLLNLDRWVVYAAKATKSATALERDCAAQEAALNSAEHTLATTDLAGLEADRKNWDAQHAARLDELTTQLSVAEEQLSSESVDVKALEAAITAAEVQMRRLDHNATINQRKRDAAVAQGNEVLARKAYLAQAIAGLDERIAFFADNPQCPTCEQVVGDAHKDACLAQLQDDRDVHTTESDTIGQHLVTARAAAMAAGIALSDLGAKRRILEQDIFNARADISAEERTRRENARRLDAMCADIDRHRAQANPLLAALERAKAERAQLTERVETMRTAFEVLAVKRDATTLWTRGFKTIRSQMVDSALAQFGMEIATVCEDLGLTAWGVTPCIDPAVFESARASSGFGFHVVDPDGVQRPLKAYSGGELQRVKLAIQLGLGALVSSLSAAEPLEWETWDEPSSYMSAEGVLGLFACLRGRAERLGKQIFVIDHHYVHSGDFTAVYNFVRTQGRTVCETV